ncbi:MAG: nucleotidyltransferase family protein [bacterium]
MAKEFGIKKLILFGSALEDSEKARDLDLACDGLSGWKIFEFGAKVEEELRITVDIVPLNPATRFTQYIEKKGKVIYAS